MLPQQITTLRDAGMTFPPERVVCLTDETVETLYLLEEDWRIVGVSGYAVRPARVRKEKPRVSAFTSADIPKILALKPDLVFTFSDLQAEIAASLIREGIEVHAFNQRSIAGILDMVRMVGALIGKPDAGMRLAERLSSGLEAIRAKAQALPKRPRVYFEEWDDPMISGIGWISETVEAAGGHDVFSDRAAAKNAKGRIVTAEEVIAAAPNIIIGSWCGKRFRPERVCARAGFGGIPAVKNGALHEVKSPLILQPGPAALTDGIQAIAAIIRQWSEVALLP
jgi:iron complex transport system substrate-binding protein